MSLCGPGFYRQIAFLRSLFRNISPKLQPFHRHGSVLAKRNTFSLSAFVE